MAPQAGALRFGNRFDVPLRDAVFTVLDMEMTGIDSITHNSIIQISAKKYKNGICLGEFTTYVKPQPGHYIPLFIQNLTGITPEKVQNAPTVKDSLAKLAEFVGPEPILVGHYIGLDINFLRKKLETFGLSHFKDRFVRENTLCTWTLAEKLYPNQGPYRAEVFAPKLGLSVEGLHDAKFDVELAQKILNCYFEKLNRQRPDIQKVSDLKTYQGDAIAWPEED